MKQDENPNNLIILSERRRERQIVTAGTGGRLTFEEVKDLVFDALNESPSLPVRDLATTDSDEVFKLVLEDGSSYKINIAEWVDLDERI